MTNKNNYIKANGIINAAGYGISSVISSLGGKPIFHLKYIHGSMALFNKKLSNQIISVCGDNFVGDVIIPFNQYTLVGSTWHEIPHFKRICIPPNDKNEIYTNTIKILPEIKNAKLISFISGIRVHYKKRSQFKKIRSGPDGFNIIDHKDLPNIVTILPGKFVLARIAAKYAVDILLGKIIKGRIPMSQTHEFIFQSQL